jgi:Na+:H+ antiporter
MAGGPNFFAMQTETVFILLFVVATTVAVAARRLRIPYTVALVIAGLVLGWLEVLSPPHLTKELLFALFLPGLLFEAAYHLQFREFWRNRAPIAALAVPGVMAAIALTVLLLVPATAVLDLQSEFGWRDALVFGSLIAATDPIAVVALFKSLGVPRRLAVLVEGESLLNDGTAVVFFTLTLAFLAGEVLTPAGMILDFVAIVGAGALVGGVVGLAVSHVIQRVDDPMIEITLTTIAAYGSFVAAEQVHASGVIATVVAGMLCGNYAARTGMSPSTRVAVESFWEYVAFGLNSVVFLLIGFEVRITALFVSWLPILAAYVAVMASRAIVMLLASLVLRGERRIPLAWTAALTWGGLRGGISMVLALSLSIVDAPHRELIVTITFGVVVLTILVNGLTMAPLLRALGIGNPQEERVQYEVARGGLQAAAAALGELTEMGRKKHVHPDVVAQLQERYEGRVRAAEEAMRGMQMERGVLREEEARRASRHLMLVEKEHVLDAYHRGVISQEAPRGGAPRRGRAPG